MGAPFERTSVPGIYRRGGRYVVTFTDDAGTRRKRSAATMAEARVLRANSPPTSPEANTAPSPAFVSRTTREWIRSYHGRTGAGIRETTLDEYRGDLEIHAIPFLGRRWLGEIEMREVKAFVAHLADKGLAPSTIRNQIAPVRALLPRPWRRASSGRTRARDYASRLARAPSRQRSANGRGHFRRMNSNVCLSTRQISGRRSSDSSPRRVCASAN